MKSVFTLLFAVVTVTTLAQLTASDVGLPSNVYNDLKNVVFTQEFIPGRLELTKLETKRTVGGVTTTTKEVVLREARTPVASTVQAGVYGINLVSNYIHEYGHEEVTQHDSGYVLVSPFDGMIFNVWNKLGKWYCQNTRPDGAFMLTDPYTKVTRFYLPSELKAMKYYPRGTTKPQTITDNILASFRNRYRIGQVYSPQTHVTSLFATLTQEANGTYRGNIYINGNLVTSGTTLPLITSYGTNGIKVGSVNWRFLNGCVQGDGGSVSTTNVFGALYYEYGNAGTCDGQSNGTVTPASLTTSVTAGNSFSYNKNEPDQVIYNSSKDFMIWFKYETQLANGKNEGADAYFNVTENRRVFSLFD